MDKEMINGKFTQAKPYLHRTDELLEIDRLDDFDSQLIAERTFEVLSQIILDVCTHISANSPLGPPNAYADCIDNLVELNILNPNQGTTFKRIIKMRNLVVHQYAKIDHELLFSALSKLKNDFKIFQKQVISFLSNNK